jgi:DNA replication regulator SLD3
MVQPFPSTTIKLRTLHPLLLLPRSRLPLSLLDMSPFPGGLSQSRLFESHIKVLELEDRMGSQPVVLIACLDDGRSLYAVEREARGLYVLLHLGSWVDVQQLRASAVASRQDLSKSSDRMPGYSTLPQAAPVVMPESSKYSKKKRLAIEAIQSMVKRPSISLSAEATESRIAAVSLETARDFQPQERLEVNPSQDDTTPPTANEIFENVRTQYFEALYLSKVCIAVTIFPLILHEIDAFRHLWHTSQKDHYRELVQHSILTMTPPLIWPNILHSSRV